MNKFKAVSTSEPTPREKVRCVLNEFFDMDNHSYGVNELVSDLMGICLDYGSDDSPFMRGLKKLEYDYQTQADFPASTLAAKMNALLDTED